MLNVVVVKGVLARPSQLVELPSGTRLLALEVTVRRPDGPAETIPVSWLGAPAWGEDLDVGESVVVAGRVRRRFFRSGGSTQSRTEVAAASIARSSSLDKVAALVAEAMDSLATIVSGSTPSGIRL